jgi:ParB-like chromosome segregation protein Spo0J
VNLVPLGLRPRLDEIMERLQLTRAEEGEPTLEPAAAPPPKVIEAPMPEAMSLHNRSLLTRLLTRQNEAPPEVVERMAENLAADAQSALTGLTDELRAVFDAATSLHDLAHRLSLLKLDPSQFANAMQRGMALAELVGQAALIDELKRS